MAGTKDTLAGIVSMLETGDPEQQVAAAQVLAWLKPRAPHVVKALGRVAEQGNAYLRPYAVESLAQIGSSTALTSLIPLLHVEGPLRSKVARAFEKLGANADKVLVREFEKADYETRLVILEILARIRGAEGTKLLFAVLKDPDLVDLGGHAKRFMIAEIEGLRDAGEQDECDALRKSLLQHLKRIPKKAPPSYSQALLELLARVADPGCRAVFFSNSGPSHPAEVRGAALRGLKGLELTASQTTKLHGYLTEDDFVNVVGPTLEVLEGFVPSGAPMAQTFARLLENARPEVRLYALAGMGHLKTPTSAKLLLPFLDSQDPKVRALASEGLGRNPEAREALVKLCLAGRDLEEVGRCFDALCALAPQLTAAQIKKLVARFLKLLEADDPVRDVYQRVIAAANEDFVAPLLIDEAKKLRNAQRFEDALRVLQTLAHPEDSSMRADVRYDLAVTTLLMRGHEPNAAEGDPVVGHFCHLIREGYDLLGRLKRERKLETDHVLYIGQRFVERLNEERAFGQELLSWMIKRQPEAKEAVQAMQKLKVEGLA